MTKGVKDVVQEIMDNKPIDVHLDLYQAVMSVVEYSQEALMAALSHLVDLKAQGTNFVSMGDNHCCSGTTCPSTTTMCSGALGHCGAREACLLACDA
jgi:hypothetical protein